jgi:uncharacterized protein YjbJ (UPF0337 family)
MGIASELQRRVGDAVRFGVGLGDKATGRFKQAAGDLLGRPDLRRRGLEEEAKGAAKEDLVEQERREARVEAQAEARKREARDRAAEAARREFAQAERQVEREEARVDVQRTATTEAEREVEVLEQATDAESLERSHTRGELERRAAELGIQGRSRMSKREIAEAIVARS